MPPYFLRRATSVYADAVYSSACHFLLLPISIFRYCRHADADACYVAAIA